MSKCLLRFVSTIPLAACLVQAQDVTGDWVGTMARPNGDLRLALHISKADAGLKATLDSVDQGVSGIPLDSVKVTDAKLTFTLTSLHASYEGTVDAAAATSIDGMITGEKG